jgi:tripeptide aminopeptidase
LLLAPSQSDRDIAERAFEHLLSVVSVESASDEDSPTIPSTPGQAVLAAQVGAFFEALGATVERDEFANVIASFAGRGGLESEDPLALMVHLDTAKGTAPLTDLEVAWGWDGTPLNWPQNPDIRVDTTTYPSLEAFVGQDIIHGTGQAPFGLDDKLGLTHMMTLAWLLHTNPGIPHRPILLIGRPDEEIGRMEALVGLADLLAERQVRSGYTVDGIEPFEVNVQNFNAAGASILFPSRPAASGYSYRLRGVNTHGATAHAEGHRAATRLATALLDLEGAEVVGIRSDPLRDCDADITVCTDDQTALEAALDAIVDAHRDRGAGWDRIDDTGDADGASSDLLAFVRTFLSSSPGFTLLCEESRGFDGYSHPYRAVPTPAGLRLDIRIRDFDPDGLQARIDHVLALAPEASVSHQYVNMGPKLADRPELVSWAEDAGAAVDQTVRTLPIRGGTGVDPFLDRGVAVANLGTGYFAPESEKELTSLQMLSGHARWLVALVQTT